MKTYKQLASDAMEKAAKIKKKRNKNIKIATTICSVFAVTVAITAALFLPKLMKKPVSPAESEINEGEQFKVEIEFLKAEESYDSLYNKLKDNLLLQIEQGVINDGYGIFADDIISGETPVPETSMGAGDFSGTNVQVTGIDEADVVKCDGDYIYSICSRSMAIVKVDHKTGNMTLASKIDFKESDIKESYISDMYISDDMLIFIARRYAEFNEEGKLFRNATVVYFYDISDRNDPKFIDTIELSGIINGSRLKGEKLYIIANDTIYNDMNKDNPKTFVPYIEENALGADRIYYDNYISSCTSITYLNVIEININNIEATDALSILGYGNCEFYQSHENIYCFNNFDTDTKIVKISTENGIELVCEGSVPGTLLNSYSMDEYNGYLRVVTSDRVNGHQVNGVYILDKQLNCIGKIEDLAKNEQIYSCRFDGEIVYFVTFRQVDPLFCADLSDPKNPKILSELKIPGFSDYLHKYSDNLLFGLGKSATETSSGYVKLSMFDITDKTNVTEIASLEIKGLSYTEASYDYHAIIVDGEKGIIGFGGLTKYYLYTFKDGEFVKLAEFNISNSIDCRGIYIGDYFFVCERTRITSYSLEDYKKIADLKVENNYVYNMDDGQYYILDDGNYYLSVD